METRTGCMASKSTYIFIGHIAGSGSGLAKQFFQQRGGLLDWILTDRSFFPRQIVEDAVHPPVYRVVRQVGFEIGDKGQSLVFADNRIVSL